MTMTISLPTTIDRIEDDLEREIRDMLDRHPVFRRFAPKTQQNMARGAAWGAVRVLTPEDFEIVIASPSPTEEPKR